jgi:drug/metabolite transporter (DMT)-like permease
LLLGVTGVGIIAGPARDAVLQTDVFGVILVFIAATTFALGAVITRRLRAGLPVQSMQAWMMLIGAPLLHVAAFVLPGERMAAVTWSWPALAGLAYLAIVAAGVGYFLYFELLDRVGAIEISLVAYATPIFAAIGGWLALGEQIHSHTIIGFSVIVIGFIIIKRRALRAVAQ